MADSRDLSGRHSLFTNFPQLPIELQEQIWDEAIQNRHAEPLAHFFTLNKECEHTIEAPILITATTCRTWYAAKQHFSPPLLVQAHRRELSSITNQYERTAQINWNHPSNRSGYLLDSGLWGACVASRQAMVRKWRDYHSATWCDCDHIQNLHSCRCFRALPGWKFGVHEHAWQGLSALPNPYKVAIACVKSPEPQGKKQWIVTRPEVDLFVCSVPDLKSLEGWELDKAARCWHPDRCHNVALYYDPVWASELVAVMMDPEVVYEWSTIVKGTNGLSSFARQFDGMRDWGPRSLWLIDERLEPVAGVPYTELVEERQTFKAAGQHFIQVKADDMGRTWTTKGVADLSLIDDPDERRLQRFSPVLAFLVRFHNYITDHFHANYWDDSEFDDWLSEPDIRESRYCKDYMDMEPMVLACLSESFSHAKPKDFFHGRDI